jgi:hypothetical protein
VNTTTLGEIRQEVKNMIKTSKFQLTIEDISQYYKQYVYKTSNKFSRLFKVTLQLFATSLFFYLLIVGRASFEGIYLSIFFSIALGLIAVYWINKVQFNTLIQKSKNLNEDLEITFSESGISYFRGSNLLSIEWNQVYEIIRNSNGIYLILSSKEVIIVPNRTIENMSMNDFIKLITQFKNDDSRKV